MKEPTIQDVINAIKEWKLELGSEDRLSIKLKYLEILVNEIGQLKVLIDTYKKMLNSEKKERENLLGKLLESERNWFETKLNIKG